MSKALVIKNADFSVNKLTTVEFIDIPCTGISLNESILSINTAYGTSTLIVTKVPENTTDTLRWFTSNAQVATVNHGIVTAINEGTATITATCGACTATCTITVEYVKTYSKDSILQVTLNGTTEIYDYATNVSTGLKPITIGVASGNLPAFGAGATLSTGSMKYLYPIPLPQGCKKIIVTSENMAPIIVYYNKDIASTHEGLYRNCAKVFDGETPAGGTNWSISSWVYGGRTFTIPINEEINAYTLSFNCNSSTVYDNFSLSNVTIEYQYS